MIEQGKSLNRGQRWLLRLGLILMGVALAALVFIVIIRLFPGLFPDGRARSVNMGVIKFTTGMGDLFLYRSGTIAPPSDPYHVLSEHGLAWDADGFRVPERSADQYTIVAIGDSYTESANVARPWPDVLAAESGLPVRNLGFRGYGPVEEARVLRDYGLKYKPRIVVFGFFEGNDLYDVVSARWRDPFVLPNIARSQFPPYDPNNPIWKTDKPGPFQYPIRLNLKDKVQDIVLFDTYLAWVNAEFDTFSRSDNMNALAATLDEMVKTAGKDTCFIFAYLPSKEHIYFPYVMPEDREKVLSTLDYMILPQPGELISGAGLGKSRYEEVLTRLDNQRDAVAAMVGSKGIPFFDLVPAFKEAAARGELLYYPYDTHWNQAGHELAGRTIAAFLARNPCAVH